MPSTNLDNIRHSLAHILAAVVQKKFPDVKLGIGPVIDDGFYYDFKFATPISEEILPELEVEMKKLIEQNLAFSGKKITATEAKKLFHDQPFKLELTDEFTKESQELTTYQTGEAFIDLCRGGHVKNTEEINPNSFKLTRLAGAYWRGSEKNPMLTRIYALAFNTKAELDTKLAQLEEAKKRDHKKLGPELDLFVFSELVGSGLPLFTPKGTILRDSLDNFVWELRKKHGYQRVDIPHITKKELYEKSGHWEKFKNDLFKITTREGHLFAMKPMNCPHHAQIYARKQWSYRELPQRYASTTKVYRDEQSGELAGISRVISITQDDAHVFCRYTQIKEEILKVWDIIETFYGAFKFNLDITLSLHDPKEREKYLGSPERWHEAEHTLRDIAQSKKINPKEAIGEAAFYGPKIDFIAHDSIGRTWQVATIQLDMNQPEGFDLTCINEKGEKERIVMIHAAIMGSIERFMSVLIEHFAGRFPVWLAPVQVVIVPISEKQADYAKEIENLLNQQNIRVETNLANETLGKRIRNAEHAKIPYILVVGEKEAESKTVTPRQNGKNLEAINLENFIEKINHEIKTKQI